mmetsp:Transcript_28339/g.62247  ORF Transcript_28339/g.62247 Transcript_28339/m.62247 type:complete len:581 (-) Transcript_28339:358-2100(-)
MPFLGFGRARHRAREIEERERQQEEEKLFWKAELDKSLSERNFWVQKCAAVSRQNEILRAEVFLIQQESLDLRQKLDAQIRSPYRMVASPEPTFPPLQEDKVTLAAETFSPRGSATKALSSDPQVRLQQLLARSQVQLHEAETKMGSMDSRIATMQQELTQMRKKNDYLKATAEAFQREANMLRRELCNQQGINDETADETTKILAELSRMHELNARLTGDMALKDSMIQLLKQQLHEGGYQGSLGPGGEEFEGEYQEEFSSSQSYFRSMQATTTFYPRNSASYSSPAPESSLRSHGLYDLATPSPPPYTTYTAYPDHEVSSSVVATRKAQLEASIMEAASSSSSSRPGVPPAGSPTATVPLRTAADILASPVRQATSEAQQQQAVSRMVAGPLPDPLRHGSDKLARDLLLPLTATATASPAAAPAAAAPEAPTHMPARAPAPVLEEAPTATSVAADAAGGGFEHEAVTALTVEDVAEVMHAAAAEAETVEGGGSNHVLPALIEAPSAPLPAPAPAPTSTPAPAPTSTPAPGPPPRAIEAHVPAETKKTSVKAADSKVGRKRAVTHRTAAKGSDSKNLAT